MKRSVLLLCSVSLASCFDPVHDDAVSALGGEAPGVSPGPTHRPGEPCLTCHGGKGPGSPSMSIGGTIYQSRATSDAPTLTELPGVIVHLIDATGATHTRTSNEVGNFYIFEDEWNPTFPVHVCIDQGNSACQADPAQPLQFTCVTGQCKTMDTRLGRNGDCGSCHRDQGGAAIMPAVYLQDKAP